MQRFTKGTLPPVETFSLYRKRALTKAIRIDGPFEVQTQEGHLTCLDGWLAIDAHGWPYPIAVDEFTLIYDKVD